jgi:hypothetical protein
MSCSESLAVQFSLRMIQFFLAQFGTYLFDMNKEQVTLPLDTRKLLAELVCALQHQAQVQQIL